MPNYDYSCKNCGHQEEIFQKMSDNPLQECPQCKSFTFARRVGGGIGLQFVGSGFYHTDYNTPSVSASTQCCPCGTKSSCSYK